jgi:small-conductance mechanosensitive channel
MVFFTNTTGWGDVLFKGANTDTVNHFAGIIILSYLFACFTVCFNELINKKIEAKTVDPERSVMWIPASFASTVVRVMSFYICMMLAMTMNVWVLLAVSFGQGTGYIGVSIYNRRVAYVTIQEQNREKRNLLQMCECDCECAKN